MSARCWRPFRSITWRLLSLFAIVLILFTLVSGILYNGLLRRQSIAHYSETMQRDAHTIAQNLSGIFLPADGEALDENRFIVSRETLAPYMALIEQITSCNVYLIDTSHNVTGYFSGVVQTIHNPLLPSYLEQCIALGFMGKTPFIQAQVGDQIYLTTSMPVMNAQSRVLGVILLESTLTSLGYAQVPSAAILLTSLAISFGLSVLLALGFTRLFTHRIHRLKHVALALAGGAYDTRTHTDREDIPPHLRPLPPHARHLAREHRPRPGHRTGNRQPSRNPHSRGESGGQRHDGCLPLPQGDMKRGRANALPQPGGSFF